MLKGVGDLDGDGDLDFLSNEGVHLYDAEAGYIQSQSLSLPGEWNDDEGGDENPALLRDLDGDDDLDLIYVDDDSKTVVIYSNDGAGVFTESANQVATTDVKEMALGDFNADGFLDLVVIKFGAFDRDTLGYIGTNYIHYNDGTGVFGEPVEFLGGHAKTVAVGDLTGDGGLDVAAVNFGSLNRDHSFRVWVMEGGPEITLTGDDPFTLEHGDTFVDPGATAFDAEDGDLSSSIGVNASALDGAGLGTYSVTYSVSDSDGNMIEVTRTVEVVDTTAPVITLVGDNPQTIPAGSTYTELGATAVDSCDQALGAVVIDSSNVDTSTPGSYIVTYDISDASGNAAVTKSRTVNVVMSDTTAPVFSGVPKDIFTTAGSSGFAYVYFAAPTATDETSPASPTVTCMPQSGTQFPVGTTTVSCSATDDAGNVATVRFEVTVVAAHDNQAPSMELVSLRGDAAPDAGGTAGVPEGATIFTHNRAFLNNSADILFEATLLNAGTNNGALYRDIAGNPKAIAVRNAPAGAGTFGTFSHLAITGGGKVGFRSMVSSKPAHFTEDGGALELQAGSTLEVPGVTGAQFSALHKPAITSSGSLLTAGSMRIGTAVPDSFSDTGLWLDDMLVGREGSPSPIPLTDYSQFAPRAVASSSSDHIAFATNLLEEVFDPSDNTAIFVGTPGSLSAVLREGDTAPGTGGAVFSTFASEVVNGTGQFAARATIRGTGVTSTNNGGLWSNTGGTLQLVAREGDIAPYLRDQLAEFDRFTTLVLADGGDIFFHAFLRDASSTRAIHSGNDGSLWRFSPDEGSLHLIAREGEIALGTDAGIIARIDKFAASDTGHVAYSAALMGNIGDSTTSNNYGIWLTSAPNMPAELVLRRNDTFELSPGDIRTIVGLAFDAEQNTGSATGGYGKALNDSGQLVVRLTLSGNSSGVFVIGSQPSAEPSDLD